MQDQGSEGRRQQAGRWRRNVSRETKHPTPNTDYPKEGDKSAQSKNFHSPYRKFHKKYIIRIGIFKTKIHL